MKEIWIFWYRTKDNKEYLLSEIDCIKPKQTKAYKQMGHLMSFDDDVIASGYCRKDEEYMTKFRYPSLIAHSDRGKIIE